MHFQRIGILRSKDELNDEIILGPEKDNRRYQHFMQILSLILPLNYNN